MADRDEGMGRDIRAARNAMRSGNDPAAAQEAATRRRSGARVMHVGEPRGTPVLGHLLGYGAVLPLVVGAAVAWLADGLVGAVAVHLSILWGSALLIFLAGVRRGLSFRTPGGPRVAQIAVMLWLFVAGLAAMLTIAVPVTPVALDPYFLSFAVLLAGFASLIVLDPLAARREEAPAFMTRLRPVQMAIAAVATGALLLHAL